MGFPIEFAKKAGPYDFGTDAINFIGNAVVVAVGGISLGLITAYALKALGFGNTVTAISTAIPVTIGIFGAAVAIAGCICVGAIIVCVIQALRRR